MRHSFVHECLHWMISPVTCNLQAMCGSSELRTSGWRIPSRTTTATRRYTGSPSGSQCRRTSSWAPCAAVSAARESWLPFAPARTAARRVSLPTDPSQHCRQQHVAWTSHRVTVWVLESVKIITPVQEANNCKKIRKQVQTSCSNVEQTSSKCLEPSGCWLLLLWLQVSWR